MRFSVHSIHIMDLRFCVQEAFGKEQAGIGPWCYPLGAEAQGTEKDWYRAHGQRTPVIGSIDRRSSIDDRTSAIKPVIPVSSNKIGGQGRPTGRDDLPQRYGCIDRRL